MFANVQARSGLLRASSNFDISHCRVAKNRCIATFSAALHVSAAIIALLSICPAAMASLRQMAPRASLSLHSKQLQQLRLLPHFRYATTAATRPPPKPRVLEKPERFNPPSHPSRRARPRQYPGPPLSEHQRQAQKLRKYPHMMPAEGSFLHWFLTSRAVHASITLVR